jgi:hypothetical protein
MALLGVPRRCRGPLAALLAIAAMLPLRAWGDEAVPADPGRVELSEISPVAAQAEAIPKIEPPPSPTYVRPETAAALPESVQSPVYLKKSAARYTVLAGQGNDLGMDIFDGETTVAFFGVPGQALTISPSAGVVFLDGPIRTDLPPRLYTGQLEFRWFGQIATPVFYEVAFMPALFTDGNNTGSDALRLQGRGVGYLAFSEQTQLVLGATYLDRKDVPILPIFGVIHSPKEGTKFELVFPKPRISERVNSGEYGETWAYIGGELGGGSWAIERQNGRDDIASYRDYRLMVGLEQRNTPAWTAAVEAGYVFGRALEYESGRGDYDPDDTFLLRLALSH